MRVNINIVNPQARLIRQVVECLQSGGVIIYPTDSVYAFGCDIFQQKAVDRICKIKGMDPRKARLSFVCDSLSDLSRYTRSIDTPQFRFLKAHIPGPFTFILMASREVPTMLKTKKNTIGLRVPDHSITRELVNQLGHPILSSSLPAEPVEALTDPDTIYETYMKLVDIFVDGGPGGISYTTVIDLISGSPEILRQGAGVPRL